MSEQKEPSAEALAAIIADKLRDDPEAEKAFRADPIKYLEEELNQSLPMDLQVEIHENTETLWHITLGARPGPIDEMQLDAIAGGRGPARERGGWGGGGRRGGWSSNRGCR